MNKNTNSPDTRRNNNNDEMEGDTEDVEIKRRRNFGEDNKKGIINISLEEYSQSFFQLLRTPLVQKNSSAN